MISHDTALFKTHAPRARPLLGMDLGTKTIGLALSDRLWTIASSAALVKRKKFTLDAEEIHKVIKANEVGGLVLGWPLNMDGSEGPRTQSTLAFARNLERLWGADMPPLLLWDERLSTVEAERVMIEADLSRKKRAERIDALAASVILQGALERLAYLD